MQYVVTEADRRPLPPSYATEPRHLGYAAADLARPYARFFTTAVRPIQDGPREALVGSPAPGELAYDVRDVTRRLAAPGYEPLEDGWTRRDGTLFVACRTDMPGVTAQMWDWWFGWHSTETARYKLWHPGAHQFSAIGEDRSADRSLTDRQRYVGNVSYVDEYIGDTLTRLAIRFVDPVGLGFEDAPGTTYVCARVGVSDLPVAGGWLIHQVRPTDAGAEMRSRFFLGHPQVLDLPPTSVSNPPAARLLASRAGRRALAPAVHAISRRSTTLDVGRALLHHCAGEMNHLAGFLPELHAEFRDTP